MPAHPAASAMRIIRRAIPAGGLPMVIVVSVIIWSSAGTEPVPVALDDGPAGNFQK
jgi:hypothetical protein